MSKQKLVVIVGPTASGKTDLSIQLAQKFDGEIISADSRQVYRELDIGSGKITKEERAGILHHLLDVADPKDNFTVSDFKKLTIEKIEQIKERGRLPIIVGGTGFYIQAVIDDLELPEVSPNKNLRTDLEKLITSELSHRLKEVDHERWQKIDKHNRPRLIRAIEIVTALGQVPVLKKEKTPFDLLLIGLYIPPVMLNQKIHQRLVARLNNGLIEEVQHLKNLSLSSERLESLGLEYRYINRYLEGKIKKDEMITQLEIAIRQYARRQMTWFRRDKRIKWITNPNDATALVSRFLEK